VPPNGRDSANGPRCATANVLAFGHAPAMPSAAFVLPRLFPLHPFTAALAHHCHRRVGDNEIVMRKSWRCRRWHCQRCDTSQGNQRCDHCVHVALQCASRECRFKRERRCYIPLFWFAQSYPLALCAIAARVSDFDTTPAPGSRDGALAADEKGPAPSPGAGPFAPVVPRPGHGYLPHPPPVRGASIMPCRSA